MSGPFKVNCLNCLKRSECTELCERARKYADQDYGKMTEQGMGRPLRYSTWGVWDRYVVSEGVVLNDRQLCVMILISSGVPSKIVKHGMKMSQVALDNCTRAIKKAYHKKEYRN
jgi:hypothetical protein